jgi:very-short-patch-repair endonuclease
VVEVDGDVHDLQIAEDERRTEALRAEGLTVLRARNEEVFDDLPGVLRRIEQAIVPSAAR